MLVSDLIEELEKYDQNKRIVISDYNMLLFLVNRVTESKTAKGESVIRIHGSYEYEKGLN